MAVTLPFVQSSPAVFWTLYLLCGLSDILDGAVARSTGTVSHKKTAKVVRFQVDYYLTKIKPHIPSGHTVRTEKQT